MDVKPRLQTWEHVRDLGNIFLVMCGLRFIHRERPSHRSLADLIDPRTYFNTPNAMRMHAGCLGTTVAGCLFKKGLGIDT
eukprot:1262557-Amphidinium_carterae.1